MRNRIFELVRKAIEELNEELEYESLRNVNYETSLFGGDSGIDSLSLAVLISELEFSVGEEFGAHVILADEKAISMKRSPFLNVKSLIEHIESRAGVKDV